MRRAAHVTCDTNATRDQVLRFGLMSPERLSVVHMGVHAAFRPLPEVQADAALNALLGTKQSVELLHVGSCIPRKRIDVLLEVFAGLARTIPGIRLLKAGGQLTADQRAFAATLGVEQQIAQLPRLDAATLAALYRRADVTLLPSDREGFGLPLLESLACGTAVVASDIAALREIGGHVTAYVPVGAVPEWCDQVRAALAIEQSTAQPQRRVQRVTHAAAFGWDACARSMVMTYTRLAHTAASTAASQTNGARS
jgi:glycosyltransferase involved in cell wall biosynthesis